VEFKGYAFCGLPAHHGDLAHREHMHGAHAPNGCPAHWELSHGWIKTSSAKCLFGKTSAAKYLFGKMPLRQNASSAKPFQQNLLGKNSSQNLVG